MVKTVIWDNDGVLVDTEELYFKVTREVLSEIGVDLTPELFDQISLMQGRSTFYLAAAHGLKAEVIARLRSDRNRRYSDLLRNGVRVLDGVEETLRRLHGKVLMGVVTSSRREHFEIIHSGTGLLHFFNFVLTREDYGKPKPNPDPFQAAIIRKGLQPEHCIIVEDSERGLAAAKAAGIRCIVVPNALTLGNDFSGAYRVLESVSEVAGEVLELLCQQVNTIQKKEELMKETSNDFNGPVKKPVELGAGSIFKSIIFELAKQRKQMACKKRAMDWAIEGFPEAPGVTEGVATVIANHEDLLTIVPDTILVYPHASPVLSPVLSKIKGFVTDTGGMLASAATIAREYGIPAVLGTLAATEFINDGDVIRVDGTNGRVMIITRAKKCGS